jgi:hypothetical protein
MASEPTRWWNPSLPQTLQISMFLLYLNAVFGIIGGALGNPALAAIALGEGAGAFGIANEKRWGYFLGVFVAVLRVALIVLLAGLTGLVQFTELVPFLFAVALVAVLVHPMSRDYQRIWFR